MSKEENNISLILEDGSKIYGKSFGYEKSVSGELVFNTGMVGYPESLTDPSYYGQILVITFPIIGIYGVPNRDRDNNKILKYFESEKIHLKGVIVADYSENYEHHNAIESLSKWLKREKVPGLYDIDTRMLTKKIREKGSMLCKIEFNEKIEYYDPNKENIVKYVIRSNNIERINEGENKLKILVIDCGCKNSILKNLLKYDVELIIVPWDYNFENLEYDGILISNGPGNPIYLDILIKRIKKLLEGNTPIFGICQGHQILGLASGAEIYKMKYGNRGMNQPVIDTRTLKCYITSQNHGYAIKEGTLTNNWNTLFINGNDESNEGIIHKYKPFFSVQFHPEGNGGPEDTNFLFKMFINLIKTKRFEVNTINYKIKKNINKILVLGSGGISIGQAGEFDYTGSQCIKALKEENIKTILINPNIATVQTSEYMADHTYFLPVIPEVVIKIIEKEKPDGILLQFGGQTALNCGIKLEELGIFQKYNIKVLGTQIETIISTENREIFNRKLEEINECIIPTCIVNNKIDAIKWANKNGYPILVRSNYSLGGLGSGFVNTEIELINMFEKTASKCIDVTLSKSLEGWKEVEYEVVRDNENNCITVCNMENIDPVGIHTGDSIVVSPSLTLNNNDYYKLRESSRRIAMHLNIVGECNVQFAVNPNPKNDMGIEYYVIEVNARLSRSSALASKATGYPLAYIATKISLGKNLTELKNSITKSTLACFEPSLDYCVIKFPKWDNNKFTNTNNNIGSCMKSIGEIMSIGRTFEESFMKGLRMVNDNFKCLTKNIKTLQNKRIKEIKLDLEKKTDNRLFVILEALTRYISVDEIHRATKINKWFIEKLEKLVNIEKIIKKEYIKNKNKLDINLLRYAKKNGFSDNQIANIIDNKEENIREYRKNNGILPYVKQIDTLAAEFPAKTNYLYTTYNAITSDILFNENGIIVLGSGSYRIGSSCEFDWCGVSCLRTLKKLNKKSIMINYNPETVSTDYDESDRLYFEELTLERILDIYELEKSTGIIVSVGGQIPNKLVMPLYNNNVKILGTQPNDIDNAENRYKFSNILDNLNIDQPKWSELLNLNDINIFSDKIGFPVIIRPSYVLSGSSMIVAYTHNDINNYFKNNKEVKLGPIVISKFIEGAKEIEFDAIGVNGELINYAISEHVENAGVHSGDATLILPAQNLYVETSKKIRKIGKDICKYFNITGPFNIQFLSKDNNIKVIECNLRASRTLPFISKTLNINMIELATMGMLGIKVKRKPINIYDMDYMAIKCPMFSFTRLDNVDPILKVEMVSTGEVASIGNNKYLTYLSSIISSGIKLPHKKSVLISIGGIKYKAEFLEYIKLLENNKYEIYATEGTYNFLKDENIKSTLLHINNSKKPNVIDYIKNQFIGLIININQNIINNITTNGYLLRRCAIDYNIPLFTNIKNSKIFISCITKYKISDIEIKSWQEYLLLNN